MLFSGLASYVLSVWVCIIWNFLVWDVDCSACGCWWVFGGLCIWLVLGFLAFWFLQFLRFALRSCLGGFGLLGNGVFVGWFLLVCLRFKFV